MAAQTSRFLEHAPEASAGFQSGPMCHAPGIMRSMQSCDTKISPGILRPPLLLAMLRQQAESMPSATLRKSKEWTGIAAAKLDLHGWHQA